MRKDVFSLFRMEKHNKNTKCKHDLDLKNGINDTKSAEDFWNVVRIFFVVYRKCYRCYGFETSEIVNQHIHELLECVRSMSTLQMSI